MLYSDILDVKSDSILREVRVTIRCKNFITAWSIDSELIIIILSQRCDSAALPTEVDSTPKRALFEREQQQTCAHAFNKICNIVL